MWQTVVVSGGSLGWSVADPSGSHDGHCDHTCIRRQDSGQTCVYNRTQHYPVDLFKDVKEVWFPELTCDKTLGKCNHQHKKQTNNNNNPLLPNK